MNNITVSVIGGNGFLGRYIVDQLLKNGFTVQILARTANDAHYLKPFSNLGKLRYKYCNIQDYENLKIALRNSDIVINSVGILAEKGKQNFHNIHVKAAMDVAKVCKENNVKKLIHISAIGVDRAKDSEYARSKFSGERAASKIFQSLIIVRPGLLIGYEDNFFNKFAKMTIISPFLPLIGGGDTKFEPVYVADVAKAIVEIAKQPIAGKIYELFGTKKYSFKELLEYMLSQIHKKRIFISIPFFIARIMAFFINLIGLNIITRDQVKLLKYDNIHHKSKEVLGFADLNIVPKNIEEIVPTYLKRFSK